jgi:hypothetical protein
LKKKTNCWSKTVFFPVLDQWNFCFLFQPSNWEKIGDIKIGCLVLFDVTNKIQKKHSNHIHNKDSDLKSSWAKYWKLLHCTIYFQICCNKKKILNIFRIRELVKLFTSSHGQSSYWTAK